MRRGLVPPTVHVAPLRPGHIVHFKLGAAAASEPGWCHRVALSRSTAAVNTLCPCCCRVCSCPCVHANYYSNQRWCCSDSPHIDLGRDAFKKVGGDVTACSLLRVMSGKVPHLDTVYTAHEHKDLRHGRLLAVSWHAAPRRHLLSCHSCLSSAQAAVKHARSSPLPCACAAFVVPAARPPEEWCDRGQVAPGGVP